jgi:hypothetical protein
LVEGGETAAVLDDLHRHARLYVNFFLPCFKLKSKTRIGAKLSKKYEAPVSPYERLLGDPRVTDAQKTELRETFNSWSTIRSCSPGYRTPLWSTKRDNNSCGARQYILELLVDS